MLTLLPTMLVRTHLDYTPIWTSYIGGSNTDKCWGVASSVEELYVVGGTISDQGTFPLKEFDTTVPQDWYDGDIFNNTADGGSGEYSFLNMRFNSMFGESSSFDPWPNHSFDAFIASFGASPALSVDDSEVPASMTPRLIDPEGRWQISFAGDVDLLRVHDATGRLVYESRLTGRSESLQIDLRERSSGIYLISVIDVGGAVFRTKVDKL